MGKGIATGAGAKLDVTLKLPQLQNFCKRDPDGYREDYLAQVRRLEAECRILQLSPSSEPSPRLVELIQFAAAVSSSSYVGEESERIASMLINLLLGSAASSQLSTTNEKTHSSGSVQISMPTSALQLHREVRKSCVSALILMRNKGAIEPLRLLELFFRIMAAVPDKGLREMLYRHVVNDVRNINKKGHQNEFKVNRSVQSFLHRVVSSNNVSGGTEGNEEESATDIAAKRATDMVCELYRKGVWTDDRSVAILASAATSRNTTVMCRAMRFFLNIEEKMAEDKAREEDDEWSGINQIDFHQHSRKTKNRMRQVTRQLKNRKKAQQKREGGNDTDDNGVEASKKLYPAIEMLRDPQGLAEAVFKRLRGNGSSKKYEVKLLMINFVTRLVGNHELLLLPLYPFLQRYMGGHQRDVTGILAYTVQACHEYVPPDEIYGILKTIAHNFITERCSGEQMAVGINAVRAICSRVPSVLSVEDSQESSGTTVMDIEAFARDLAAYAKHRDRSVSIAGRTWTNFIREVYPSLLQGKDRGSVGAALHRAGEKPLRYGEQKVAAGVAGADLLVEYEARKALAKNQTGDNDASEDDGDGIQEERMNDEVSDDGSGEWVDVKNEEGEAEEDSDNEAPQLMLLKDDEEQEETEGEESNSDGVLNLSKMSAEERKQLQQKVSSTRVFSTADFERMRKLVEREERAKRDPREAARRKRAIAAGKEFEELSDDGSDYDSDEGVHIAGAVNPGDIMADVKKKRISKAEKLEKIVAGREKFESKSRDGGSTNIEKKRKKNFQMTKYAFSSRQKRSEKDTIKQLRKGKSLKHNRDAKKRRRKL